MCEASKTYLIFIFCRRTSRGDFLFYADRLVSELIKCFFFSINITLVLPIIITDMIDHSHSSRVTEFNYVLSYENSKLLLMNIFGPLVYFGQEKNLSMLLLIDNESICPLVHALN